mmetsp:Transcript_12408/g.21490  ORF Transcript_12408/g.21490 Transcript_12408/m.21490 type:complete len:148 (+) Transcript_12408:3-446(+)
MLQQPRFKEACTNEVDLTSDVGAGSRCVNAVLLFLQSNSFDAGGDTQFAFSVRRLADRYRMTDLMERVEQQLECLLCEDNALSFLGEVTGSSGRLESACLARITQNSCELLADQQDKLDEIADGHPELAKQLFRLLVAGRGKKRALE